MAKYTVKKGCTYLARIELGFWERMASNEQIAAKFTEAGFENVTVAGSDGNREVTGTWNQPDASAEIPEQVTDVQLVEE